MKRTLLFLSLMTAFPFGAIAETQENEALALQPEAAQQEESFTASIADGELNENRGTFAPIVINTSEMLGTSSGNSNSGDTGDNFIGNGAFDGLTGYAVVVQNSGNNNVIQSSTIINVNMQ
jgi:hypothetical protein